MGIQHFEAWRESHNAAGFTIHQLARAEFVWHGRNRYSFNRLFQILTGEGSLVNHTAKEEFRLCPGTVWLMPRQLDLEFDFPAGLTFLALHFNLYRLPGLDHYDGESHCRRAEAPPELSAPPWCAASPPDWPEQCRMESHLWQLLALFPAAAETDRRRQEELHRRYHRLLAFIRDRLTAETGVAELAEAAGMSRDALSRGFSRDFGVTLKRFTTDRLTAAAENYLLGSELSVKEIAARLCFRSEFYFSSFFKRERGVSPQKFRASSFGGHLT